MTMSRNKLAILLMLIVGMDLLLCTVDATPFWRRRRRRRRSSPPPPPPPPPCSSSRPRLIYQGRQQPWANTWQQSFSSYCPNGYRMYWWFSHFRQCQGDRINYFRCRGNSQLGHSNCNWTPYSVLKRSFSLKCPHNKVVIAVTSRFDKASKDRRWAIRCCTINGYELGYCSTSSYQNRFEQNLNSKVAKSNALVGVASYYSASFSDRRWRFEVCRFQKRWWGKK